MSKETAIDRLKNRLKGRKIPRQPVYDKTQVRDAYFRLPKNIERYIFIPEFRPEMCYLYALIVDWYNAKKGYAYPSIRKLSIRYGRNEKTTLEHLKVLEAVGLLDIEYREGDTNAYRPLHPLSKDEFFEVFPEAKEERERIEQERKEAKKRKKRGK